MCCASFLACQGQFTFFYFRISLALLLSPTIAVHCFKVQLLLAMVLLVAGTTNHFEREKISKHPNEAFKLKAVISDM